MIATGFPTSAALTFLLSAPAINGRPTAGIAATAVTAIPAPAEPYELPCRAAKTSNVGTRPGSLNAVMRAIRPPSRPSTCTPYGA
jgi:hypothetical protein